MPDPRTRHDEVFSKFERVRSRLEERGLDGALFRSQAGFAWITCGGRNHVSIGDASGVASVLVTASAAFLLTNNIEQRRIVEEEIQNLPMTALDYRWHGLEGEAAVVRQLCDPARTVADLEGAGVPVADDIVRLRYDLLPSEIERYRDLGRDAAEAIESACRAARPDDREADVAARVAADCVARDILPLVILVAGADRIPRYRHPIPTTAPVGHRLLVALTGRRGGLHASLTRMVAFSDSDAEFVRRHDAVTMVDARAIFESRPGATLQDVFIKVIDQYAIEGFPNEWELHHQGGLTGYSGREIFATPGARHRLGSGQALAWNPSITQVKSEDTVIVTDAGFDILTDSGRWPQRTVEFEGREVRRPAVLSG